MSAGVMERRAVYTKPCPTCGAGFTDAGPNGYRWECGHQMSHEQYEQSTGAVRDPVAAPMVGVSSVSSVSSHKPAPAVRAFPVEALPAVLYAIVDQGARALDCPADLVALPALAMVAGVIGNRHVVQLKPGWQERAILWTAVVAEPGTAKSPAQAIPQASLDVLQREAHERWRGEKEIYDQQLDVWQGSDKRTRGERPLLPRDEEHFYTTDSTTEAIGRMLGSDQSVTPGVTIINDELAHWIESFDAYRKGGDRQTFLSLWAGASLKSDRAGRDSIYIPRPVVPICGGIQPARLPLLAGSGCRDGFIERMLFAFPETKPMGWTEESVSESASNAFTAALSAIRTADGSVVTLSEEAKALYVAWVNENATLLKHMAGMIRGWYAKAPSQVARLALVLHCLTHAQAPGACVLDGVTMRGALCLIEYFRDHAYAVFAQFGDVAEVSHPLALRTLRVLKEAKPRWVTMGLLHRAVGGHVKSDALRTALAGLEAGGLARGHELAPGPVGGRPREEWRYVCEETEQTEQTSALSEPGEKEVIEL